MKTFYPKNFKAANLMIFVMLLCVMAQQPASAQVCSSPNTIIYGLTAAGSIRPVNVNTAAVGASLNGAYNGNAASLANGLGYNAVNDMFYYFKRNANTSPQEFVSYEPSRSRVKILASCPTTLPVRTGCVNFDGTGFYALDAGARLYFYNIALNSWSLISSTFFDTNGNNITRIIQTLNSGDIAIDGMGNLWILASNDDNYGLYKVNAPLPILPVSRITASERISPASETPTGSTFVGIAFNPTGQIYASTYADDRLYRIENNLRLTYIGRLNVANSGNDLTSCSYPMTVLPITLQNFTATADNHQVKLSWTDAAEKENTGYVIEHSIDQTNWEKVGVVKPGATGVTEKYSFTHVNAINADHYYRIKQTDLNGQTSYSIIRSATIKASSDVAVWPNPTKEAVYINSNVAGTVKLFDAFGRAVLTGTLKMGVNTLNVHSLPSGTYIVHMTSAAGQVQTKQLVKQ